MHYLMFPAIFMAYCFPSHLYNEYPELMVTERRRYGGTMFRLRRACETAYNTPIPASQRPPELFVRKK
jgi:hypothetical protein